ncbi:radical SAM additional 4Fe4S-binding SPASM domain-containing protein [Thermodesulfovibrio aggregans]|uniref:Radical SAM additional 4Fe4S-binding SPASM domain-containing protein n=1 Tax=Thermodesulfovibrio aggregans TaxID=86166 RepID=A0A0U9HLD4_9BACT|nr:radical SAM protein [Thermodesulfovibrio aggregans]GAQ93907.1 radical SAM additional 4Fe4S-binding SPASM domain-containing protein [Thermodesulfovibrio aggregans]
MDLNARFQKGFLPMKLAEYYLNENFFIKLIEFPALYNIKTDELYSLNEKGLEIIQNIEEGKTLNIKDKEEKEFINYCLNEGILTTEPQKRIKTLLRQSPIPSLRYLELQITNQCNLRCKHCFVDRDTVHNLRFEKIQKILKEFEQMQGLRVLITGGEPLMHPEFEKINDFIKELPIRKILFTNGVLLNDNILKKLNVEEIQISLDGMKKGHEILRGKGTFDKTIEAIKKAADYGFQVSVATVIHKGNVAEFDELENLIKTMKIREWTVDALTVTGSLKLHQQLWVSPDEAYKIMQSYGFSVEDHPRLEGFGCGTHLLAVLATGQAAFCSFYEDEPIGNIDEGLENVWKRKKQIVLKELECAELNCPFLEECRGGCRFRATVLNRKEKAPDLFKCYQFGRLKP